MLVIIIYWIYVSIICISLGDAALHCFRKIFVVNQEKAVHPALRFITGLSIITFLGNAVSIFYRINIEFNVLIFLFSLIWIITHLKVYKTEINSWHRQLSSLNWLIWIAGFLFFLIAIIQASAPVDHHDEGGYYLPLVRWIEQYPVVPGSAWFLDRLGYNSAFHMSNAIFGEAFLFPGGFNDLGACLFIWVNWWFLTAFNRLLKKNYTFFYSDLLLSAALVVPFTFLNNTMDSDYPNLFIGIIILGLWIRKIESGNLWLIDLTVLLMLIFGLYLSTVRLFSVLLLLFPGFILLNESIKSKSKVLITAIVVGMIYLLPWLIRNYYLTGYLVYPFYFVDLFNPDWKLPESLAKANYVYVAEFAKRLVDPVSYDYQGFIPYSFKYWFPIWCQFFDYTILDILVRNALPVSGILFISLWFKKSTSLEFKYLKLTMLLIFAVLVLWFFKFPSIRFAWNWILSFSVLTFGLFIDRIIGFPRRIVACILGLLISAMLVRGVMREVISERNLVETLLVPEKTVIINNYKEKKIGGITVKVAPRHQCWGVAPPCMPYHNFFEIEMRGAKIEDGFRQKK